MTLSLHSMLEFLIILILLMCQSVVAIMQIISCQVLQDCGKFAWCSVIIWSLMMANHIVTSYTVARCIHYV